MKKLIVVLMLLLLVSPALAAVDVTAIRVGNLVIVKYDATTEPNLPRAFALDITVDSGAVIKKNPGRATIGSACEDPYEYGDFDIFPGSAGVDINDTTGQIDSYGSSVADPCDFPSDTKLGYGTNGITFEGGTLYAPTGPGSPNAPPLTGILLKFWICQDANVTITENTVRGGIVLEDGTNPVTTNLPYTYLANLTADPTWGVCARPMGDLNGDGVLRTSDITRLVGILAKYPGFRLIDDVGDPNWDPCGDMDVNGWLRTTDITKIVSILSPCAGYRIMAPPCP